MSIAPEPILKAGNETVSWACIFVRNQTLRDSASTKIINELMEAIHEVPRMLTNWGPDTLREIRIHFGCFPAARWPGAPDLVAIFDQKLKDNGYNENAT